ncbi:MAG: hypothetical protein E6J34_08600 [Chloroflexi bacterium]|nr:MAG: hypothetical protein E6J34_08600 [Chloroflexota bacterium]
MTIFSLTEPAAKSALVANKPWDQAIYQALAQTHGVDADVVLLFSSGKYADHFQDMLRIVRRETGASSVLGCSGEGVIGTGTELEEVPALSLLRLSLPGATLHTVRFTQQMVEHCTSSLAWSEQLGIAAGEVNSWLIFADPLHMDCEGLLDSLTRAYSGLPMVGGLAANDQAERCTYLFRNDEVYRDGAIGLAIGGPYTLHPLVSQACEPIGETWTITSVHSHGLIESISNRPAYDLLIETFKSLPAMMQHRAQRNLLVGLAADEYCHSFERGSFLIRPLLGVDRRTGTLAIGAVPRLGQTIQFQLRDAHTASLDLQQMLMKAKKELGDRQPVSAILCTCNGRGEHMFACSDHDAQAIERELGPLPLAGFFCNGEIGPVGKRAFLHGFTACLALVVKQY